MKIERRIVREMMNDFIRLQNKFQKLVSLPLDFGTGDLLYPGEIHAIDEIGKRNGRTVGELASLFGVTKGAVSQMVSKLEDKGYVKKTRSADSGREKILALTAKGRKAFEGHARLHEAVDEDFVDRVGDITSREIEQFKRILDRIEEHIDRYLRITGG